MICQRCAKDVPNIHTCSPSDLVRKLEAEVASAIAYNRNLQDAIEAYRAEVAELRGVATLAYRALDDSHRVLSTIDGDDTHEQFELGVLAKRVQDVSVSLFVVLRQNDAALAKDPGHE